MRSTWDGLVCMCNCHQTRLAFEASILEVPVRGHHPVRAEMIVSELERRMARLHQFSGLAADVAKRIRFEVGTCDRAPFRKRCRRLTRHFSHPASAPPDGSAQLPPDTDRCTHRARAVLRATGPEPREHCLSSGLIGHHRVSTRPQELARFQC
ncbi:hypothetical protein FQZ97_696640 [compost metagenome]